MGQHHMHTIGAFAIITDEAQRVLLCHRTDRDMWNLPGGRVEESESPWEAVIREVEEEVGLSVSITKLLGVYAVPDRQSIAFAFLCSVLGGQLRLSDEADNIQWFDRSGLPTNTLPRHVERVNDAFLQHDGIWMKIQD